MDEAQPDSNGRAVSAPGLMVMKQSLQSTPNLPRTGGGVGSRVVGKGHYNGYQRCGDILDGCQEFSPSVAYPLSRMGGVDKSQYCPRRGDALGPPYGTLREYLGQTPSGPTSDATTPLSQQKPDWTATRHRRIFERYSSSYGPQRGVKRRKIVLLVGMTCTSVLSGCTSVLGSSPEERLLETYREGYSDYKKGVELHNDAVIAYKSDANSEVERKIDDALGPLSTARDSFQLARDIAADNQLSEARKIVASAVERTRLLIEASRLLRETARQFRTDNPEKAQESYDAYRARHLEFEKTEIYPPQVLEERLNTGILDL